MNRKQQIDKLKSRQVALALREDDYWTCSRRPLTCLIFLLPLLVVYEVGVIWLGGNQSESVRNGADDWMRMALREIGLVHSHLLPAIVIGGLMLWQVVGRHRWRISAETLLGMLSESVLFALVLIIFGQLQNITFQQYYATSFPPSAALGSLGLGKAVSYVGAGVYEEVLFRLWMLPLFYGICRMLFRSRNWAAATAILITSVSFSLAHYLGPTAESFSMITFTFRAGAGCFFAVLFMLRGFGITVGCHAAYDLLVGLILAGPVE